MSKPTSARSPIDGNKKQDTGKKSAETAQNKTAVKEVVKTVKIDICPNNEKPEKPLQNHVSFG